MQPKLRTLKEDVVFDVLMTVSIWMCFHNRGSTFLRMTDTKLEVYTVQQSRIPQSKTDCLFEHGVSDYICTFERGSDKKREIFLVRNLLMYSLRRYYYYFEILNLETNIAN